ncbi:MAG: creatininase family protein [Gemmatimonadetes bacterium]|nr:creatininase family protein [Gemmatimonadota bacterium]
MIFPPVSVGASGSNEIGRQYSFAGTYAVRPSTLRAAFVDLASELGEQGFRWVLVVHVHGSPLHIGRSTMHRTSFTTRTAGRW